jgi:hypothetical protein
LNGRFRSSCALLGKWGSVHQRIAIARGLREKPVGRSQRDGRKGTVPQDGFLPKATAESDCPHRYRPNRLALIANKKGVSPSWGEGRGRNLYCKQDTRGPLGGVCSGNGWVGCASEKGAGIWSAHASSAGRKPHGTMSYCKFANLFKIDVTLWVRIRFLYSEAR